SSRRRHTRSKRDWSSDVCSSDLGQSVQYVRRDLRSQVRIGLHDACDVGEIFLALAAAPLAILRRPDLSEEYILDPSDAKRQTKQIGRASCRERVWTSGVCGLLKE